MAAPIVVHVKQDENNIGAGFVFLQGGRGGAGLGRVDWSVVMIDCFQLVCPDLSSCSVLISLSWSVLVSQKKS